MASNAADEAKRMSRLHQAWIIATLEKHGGECTYGELVEVGEEHQCDTVGSMIKYLKNKKVIHFDKSYLMFPMHAAEKVTLLDASILGDLSNALAEAQAVAAGGSAAGMAAVDAEDNSETEKIAAQLDDASLEETETPIEQSGSGFYSLEKLQTAPFPPGIDNAKRETYLEDEVFLSIFGMDKQSFAALPGWKRTAAKKKHKLF